VGTGAPSRTWTYTWSGLDLVRIERPDGSAWEMTYSADPNLPGYLTRLDLKGSTGGLGRVERAWEYDARGNVARTWRGDPSPAGPGVVDLHSLAYDAPHLPARTEVTDPLGQVTVYELERDPGSRKPRITRIDGDCPTCGSGPNATFEYGDIANPLLPTVEVDGRGLRTEWTYDARGQVTRRLDAAGTPLQRATEWQYHPNFPALATRVTVPSTSGGAALRETVMGYDAQGNLTSRTEKGAENGGAFSLVTEYAYNAGGQPLSIDPPGHGTADVVTFAYDPARGSGHLVPLSRTDPLLGATTFVHDAFNRRTGVTDVNSVETRTAYDGLDRVTSVTQVGDGDLVTTYTYTPFGEPYQTMLPRGNVVEHGYDGAGRLLSIERKPDASTPGERAFYTLDAAGHRVREEMQRWDGAAWVTESATRAVFSSRCHLDQVIRGDGTADAAMTEYAYDCNGNLEKVWDANHPRATNLNPTPTATGPRSRILEG
jgi:YD repeat-containing protein